MIELRGLVNFNLLILFSYYFRDVAISLYEDDLALSEKVSSLDFII